MHKVTIKRHTNLLNFLINEYHKLLKKVITYNEKKNISAILLGLEHNLKHFPMFSREQMKILRREEKNLIDLLNQYRELNNELTMERIFDFLSKNK